MKRLLVVSNRAPFCSSVERVVKSSTVFLVYDYQTANLQCITQMVKDRLCGHQVASVALLLHCDQSCIFICYPENKFLNLETVQDDPNIKCFLHELISNLVEDNDGLHIFNSPQHNNTGVFTEQIVKLLGCSVQLVSDLFGSKDQQAITDKYFVESELMIHLHTQGNIIKDQ